MRILMMCYEFPPIGGGGAGVVRGLSAQLVRMGHEVDVVTMRYRGLPKRELVDGVDVHRVPCVRLSTSWCTMAEQATYLATVVPYAVKLARRRYYDINHTHFIFPDGLAAMSLRRIVGLPYMITSHGSDVPGFNPHRFLLAHRTLAPVWRQVVAGAEQIVCPSELQQGARPALDAGCPDHRHPQRHRRGPDGELRRREEAPDPRRDADVRAQGHPVLPPRAPGHEAAARGAHRG